MKLIVNERILDLSHTQIMGILNVTPDSFFDGGKYYTLSRAIDHVAQMIMNGATLIDIGGESTRPGSKKITELEESERVLPVIHEVIKRFDVFVSVNTSSALVIKESSKIGAHLINDVRSLKSNQAIQAMAESTLAVCLTHMQGNPNTMQYAPTYSNVVYEVNDFFENQISRCQSQGIDKTRLLIDPGFGFGKSILHNYQLLSNLKYFHHLNVPVLIGISRKSMINYQEYNSPKKKLIGSVTGAIIAAMQGVHIIRVHDVKETRDALQVIKMMKIFNRNMERFI